MRNNSLVLLFALLLLPSAAGAQAAASATSLRTAPDGRLVATLRAGAPLESGDRKGAWTSVVVEGFLHTSVTKSRRNELVVSAPSGAALRESASRSGAVIAVLEDAASVKRLSTSGDWQRVRREGWVRTKDIAAPKAAAPTRAAPPPAPAPRAPVAAPPAARGDAPGSLGDFAAAHRLVLRAAPNGAPSGAADSAARMRVISRDHGWARVQFEGWVRESDLLPVDSAAVSTVSAADLRGDPDRYHGATVRWLVQAIAVQSADPLRKGLAPDEPYLLARGPGSESSLLYLALPPSLVASARALQPLASVMILARVRAGRSEPSGVPILDVLRIVPR
jgi:hypothetical protein